MQFEKTLIVGAKGFLGRHFFYFYQRYFPAIIGTHYTFSSDFARLDLSTPKTDFQALSLQGYKYALIAGGICNPQKCEENPYASYKINVDGILFLSELLLAKGITPILVSSGYVFNGEIGNYMEEDPRSPINWYGAQKAALEKKALEQFKDQCLIVRIAKVFGIVKGDGTLIDEIILSLFQSREVLAAKDQILSPISIQDVIQGITALQKNQCRGLYHLGGLEQINRYELALKIARELQVNEHLIKKISLDELPASFKRPKRSDLLSQKLLNHTNIKMTSFRLFIKIITSQYVPN